MFMIQNVQRELHDQQEKDELSTKKKKKNWQGNEQLEKKHKWSINKKICCFTKNTCRLKQQCIVFFRVLAKFW